MAVTILLADDHPVVRLGLRACLAQTALSGSQAAHKPMLNREFRAFAP